MNSMCRWLSTWIVIAVAAALPGCRQQTKQQDGRADSEPTAPVLKILIDEYKVSVHLSMHGATGFTSGGLAEDRLQNKGQFKAEHTEEDGTRTFLLRGTWLVFTKADDVPEDQRGAFEITADSESTRAVPVQVNCPVPVEVLLDGKAVVTPFVLPRGSHQFTMTGRFEPGS